MLTYRTLRLSAKRYKDRLEYGGWTLHGSFRASKRIAGRKAPMSIRRVPGNVVLCKVMWRASSAGTHAAWRTDELRL